MSWCFHRRIRRQQKANEKFHQGVKLYNEAWTEEINLRENGQELLQRIEPAAVENLKKFHLALAKFEKSLALNTAFQHLPHDILKYSRLVRSKIVGHEKLRRAATCARQAGEAFQQHDFPFSYLRFGDAIEDYEAANQFFTQGFQLGDSRFEHWILTTKTKLEIVSKDQEKVRKWKTQMEEKRKTSSSSALSSSFVTNKNNDIPIMVTGSPPDEEASSTQKLLEEAERKLRIAQSQAVTTTTAQMGLGGRGLLGPMGFTVNGASSVLQQQSRGGRGQSSTWNQSSSNNNINSKKNTFGGSGGQYGRDRMYRRGYN